MKKSQKSPNKNVEVGTDSSVAVAVDETDLVRLRDWIQRCNPGSLGTIENWAAKLGRGKPGTTRFMKILRTEGVVQFGRGLSLRKPSGIEVLASNENSKPSNLVRDRSLFLVSKIQEEIQSGNFSAGESLPKSIWFTNEYQISPNTVSRVMLLLARENLIYKKGRQWIVGNPQIGAEQWRDKVILLFCTRLHTWRSLTTSPRTMGFTHSLEHEADKFGVRLIPVFDTQPGKTFVGTQGKRSIGQVIQDLGERYLGTICVEPVEYWKDPKEWVQFLTRFGPVTHFDPHNKVIPELLKIHRYKRVHFFEPPSIDICRDFLLEKKARKISFVSPLNQNWATRRGQALAKSFAKNFTSRVGPEFHFVGPIDSLPFTDSNKVKEKLVDQINKLARDSKPFREILLHSAMVITKRNKNLKQLSSELQNKNYGNICMTLAEYFSSNTLHKIPDIEEETAWVIFLTPLLIYLTVNINPDWLVFPNDQIAAHALDWFMFMGIEKKQKFKVLSFDNDLRYRGYPMATVDFGFRALGYRAFHSLAKIVSVGSEGMRNISAKPRIIERAFR